MKQEEKQMRQYLRQGETMEKIRDRMGTPEEIGKRFSEELGTDRKPSWIWLPRAGLLLSAVFLACGAVCLAAGQKRRNAAALILAVLAVATALGGGILGWLSPDGIGLYLAGGVQNLWFWAGAAGALLVALGALVFVIAKMMSRKK